MTRDDVRARVAEIAKIAGDDETAHSMEDELHAAVLREIAYNVQLTGDEAGVLAAEALRTLDIEFERW